MSRFHGINTNSYITINLISFPNHHVKHTYITTSCNLNIIDSTNMNPKRIYSIIYNIPSSIYMKSNNNKNT
ncbi:hypothetical protein HanPSC8_Chr17g0779321 [Helianthus annuus]|nr:hypothetical protein HanPSC8_Chr17g0779321 [Helianthus annuus]